MKKIAIITFHAPHNYGSNLQAYALQNKVIDLGYECDIINYRTSIQKEVYYIFTHRKGLKFRLKNLYTRLFIFKDRKKKYDKFENFINTKLKLTKEICTEEEFENIVKQYDSVISGSDQIWNLSIEDFDKVYMLPGDIKNKVTYAVSTGEDLTLDYFTPEHTDLIQNIDHISVRDSGTADLIEKIIGTRPNVVVDPTMLYDSEFYDQLVEDEPIIKGEYIYLYTLGNDPELLEIARKLSAKTGLPFYISHVSGTHYMFGTKKVLATGPVEFLNHIKYAKYVVVSSFHGTLFSILYHKQFWAYKPEKDNRKKEILTVLDLMDRSINIDNCNAKFDEKISEDKYSCVDEKLSNARKNAVDFLSNALEGK